MDKVPMAWGMGPRRLAAVWAAVNWGAVIAWVQSVNWVAVSTTFGVVVFNVTLGIVAAVNHYRKNKIAWAKEDEELRKASLAGQLDDLKAQLVREGAMRAEADAKAEAERAELQATIKDKESRINEILDSLAKERKSIHEQRNEMNKQSIAQLAESAELRRQLRETSQELAQARRDLYSAKQHAEHVAADTVSRVEAIVNSKSTPEAKD